MCLSWRTWLLWSCLAGMCWLTSRSFLQFSPMVHLAQQIQSEAGGEVTCPWFCCFFISLVMVPGAHALSFSLSFAEKMTNLKNVQFSSVTQSCLTFWDPMDCSTPGLPVRCQLLESSQTLVHWASDVIQPSHLLSSSSSPVFNLSQYQSLIQWVGTLHQVVTVLELQLQHQCFQWVFRTDYI